MEEAAIHALRNERFVMGESVFRFEEEFARFCGVKHAVSVSSGTAALQLTLQALGLTKGSKRVITTPMSFIATANAIVHAQATPAFADVTPHSALIDPRAVREASAGTSAIIPVHLYGTPAPLDEIRASLDPDVPLIEDACQAHGARIGGKRAGSVGVAGCFSFYSIKNMTVAGDGGMVTTDDEEIAARVRSLRDCGRKSQYVHSAIGYTARLNTVNAAIGRVQLKSLDRWNEKRRRIAAGYSELLRDVSGISLPPAAGGVEPVFHLYVITANNRDGLQAHLARAGIETGVHYPVPIHLQEPYRKRLGHTEGDFPVAERHAREALSLPMFPDLTAGEARYVAEEISSFDEGAGQ